MSTQFNTLTIWWINSPKTLRITQNFKHKNMHKHTVRFNKKNHPDFFKELNKRVNGYFKENNISKHANLNMIFKTIFMLSLYFIPWLIMLSGVITSFWGIFFLWILMGLGMAGIGLSIMHDANHGAYSNNKNVNKLLGFIINFVGGYHVNWKIQHNVLHHSYTNVHGFDEDIDKGVLRMSPNQEHKNIFRYQIFYAPFLYSIMTIYWAFIKDFQLLVRYNKKDLLKSQGMTFYTALAEILFHKTWYFVLFLVLPLIFVKLAWWEILIGFISMHLICGLILALIFQPAHVIEETDFFVPDEEGNVENHWAIHQMRTTSNFANKSIIFSWLIGGLNYQIEHHLFPHICHVHYRSISSIVKETAQRYDIPYHQHTTFLDAIKSHFTVLNQLGTGEYDELILNKELAKK